MYLSRYELTNSSSLIVSSLLILSMNDSMEDSNPNIVLISLYKFNYFIVII